MRRTGSVVKGLGLLSAALGLVALLTACNARDFIDQVNFLLAAPGFNVQRMRSIQANSGALSRLDRVDVAAGLDANTIATVVSGLADQLNALGTLKKEGLTVSGAPKLTPLPGALKVELQLHKEIEQGELAAGVDVVATGEVIVSGLGNAVLLAVHFDSIALKAVQVRDSWPARWFRNLDGLVPIANTTIRAVLPVLNAAVERGFNETDRARVALEFPPLKSTNLAKLSTAGGLQLADKAIAFNASIEAVAVLVDPTGLYLMAQVENKAPVPVPSDRPAAFPTVDGTRQAPSDAQVDAAYQAWRQAYRDRYAMAFGADAPLAPGSTYAVVTKVFLGKALADLVNTAPQVCGSAHAEAAPPGFGMDLKFPNLSEAQCPGLLQSCSYKDVCANQAQCEHSVNKVFDEFCPGNITESVCEDVVKNIPFLGDVLKKVCKTVSKPAQLPCKISRAVTEPLDSPFCSAFRATRKATPLLCNVASNTTKAACDAVSAPGALVCTAEQGLRSVIDKNPFARVDGEVAFSGDAHACIAGMTVDPGLTSASFRLNGEAKGHVDLSVRYKNKIAPGIGLCTTDWSETFGENVTSVMSQEALSFAIAPEKAGNDGVLKLNFHTPDREMKIDLSPAPVDAVFLKHPQLIANCRLAAAAVLGYIGYDFVWSEKLKQASPYVSGKGIPLPVKGFGFSVAVAPMSVELAGARLVLTPVWGSKALAFLDAGPARALTEAMPRSLAMVASNTPRP